MMSQVRRRLIGFGCVIYARETGGGKANSSQKESEAMKRRHTIGQRMAGAGEGGTKEGKGGEMKQIRFGGLARKNIHRYGKVHASSWQARTLRQRNTHTYARTHRSQTHKQTTQTAAPEGVKNTWQHDCGPRTTAALESGRRHSVHRELLRGWPHTALHNDPACPVLNRLLTLGCAQCGSRGTIPPNLWRGRRQIECDTHICLHPR